MKPEEQQLAESLLYGAPDTWPEPLKGLEYPERVPEELRAKIRGHVRQVVAEVVALEERSGATPGARSSDAAPGARRSGPTPGPRRSDAAPGARSWFSGARRYWLPAAAALPVVLAVGAYFLLMPKFMLQPVRLAGQAQLHSGSKTAPLEVGRALRATDSLTLPSGAVVDLTYARGRAAAEEAAALRITGPASIDVRRLETAAPTMELFIARGTIFLDSEYKKEKNIVWLTSRLRSAPHGTAAQLSVNDYYQTLEVLTGAFQVRDLKTGKEHLVRAGESLTVNVREADAAPNVRKLHEDELEELQRKQIKQDGPVPSRDLKFATEEEIRKHYGSLQKVILHDGRAWSGHVLESGRVIKIHTIYEIIEVDKSKVKEIKEIK